MNVDFWIESEVSHLEASVQERILRLIASLHDGLIELYGEIDRTSLENVRLTISDGKPDEPESSCTRNTKNPNHFLMRLVPSKTNALEEIVAHELCHIMQMIGGDLLTAQGEPGSVIWKGKKYRMAEFSHWERPWEKEAMLNAFKLHAKFVANRGAT